MPSSSEDVLSTCIFQQLCHFAIAVLRADPTCSSHEREGLAVRAGEGDILDDGPLSHVRERDVLEPLGVTMALASGLSCTGQCRVTQATEHACGAWRRDFVGHDLCR